MAPKKHETFGMVRGTCPNCHTQQILKLESGIDPESKKVVHRISCMNTRCGRAFVLDQAAFEEFLAGKGDTELV